MINLVLFLIFLLVALLLGAIIISYILSFVTFDTKFRGYNIKCAEGKLRVWKEGFDKK